MSNILKELAGQEIKVRKEQLNSDFLKHCRYFAQASIIVNRLSKYDANDRDIDLLKHEVALHMLATLERETTEALFFDDNNNAVTLYRKIHTEAVA